MLRKKLREILKEEGGSEMKIMMKMVKEVREVKEEREIIEREVRNI